MIKKTKDLNMKKLIQIVMVALFALASVNVAHAGACCSEGAECCKPGAACCD